MTRPVLARLAACLATGLVTGLMAVVLTPGAGHAAAAARGDTPLEVAITSMSPSQIPSLGDIIVSGRVTNTSESDWTDLNVYLLTSEEPFTSSEDLEEASTTDPEVDIGGRLFDAGLYDEIGDLEPGASTSYTLSVPRGDLQITGTPGVYWLGVHVLGAEDGIRDSVADGRARTFIPLMDPQGPGTTMSLVVPIKATVKRRADGSLANLAAWQRLLDEGRLGRLLELSGTSVDVPLTWVVDPAVLDAAVSVAADNPPLDTSPTDSGDDPTNSPSAEPSPSDDTPVGEEAPELSAAAEVASDWLDTFRRQADQHTILTTPFGDVDLAAMLRGDFTETYEKATDLSLATMAELKVSSSPVIAPASGYLPNVALPQIDPNAVLILGDFAAPGAATSVMRGRQGHRIVLTNTSAGQGGPAPTPGFLALAMRQRILSEAALHALAGSSTDPLVVSTPQDWDPGGDWQTSDFFEGFDVPWLRAVGLPSASGTAGEEYGERLAYPGREQRAELPIANLLAAEELIESGIAYADLLTRNDTVDDVIARAAMVTASYRVRTRPNEGVVRARETTNTIRTNLAQVTIDGPPSVTMSSAQGNFQVTVVNGLQEPVTVGIEANIAANYGGSELVISSPEQIALGPGQRTSVRLRATATGTGLHSVTLVPTSPNGHSLGSGARFNVRSSQVGLVIWVIMGVGAAVLLVAAGIRIVRRIRARGARGARGARESALEDRVG